MTQATNKKMGKSNSTYKPKVLVAIAGYMYQVTATLPTIWWQNNLTVNSSKAKHHTVHATKKGKPQP